MHSDAARSLGWALAMVLACSAVAAPPARAQSPAPDAELAELLAPWGPQWARLDPGAQARLEANARRWQQLDEDARTELLLRLVQWDAQAPAERARRRAALEAFRALPGPEREAVVAAAQRYQQASAEQREAWRAAFEAQALHEQRAWALGPSLGSWLQRVRPLFAFVPEEEREASLALLVGMDEAMREDLEALVRRMPPAERDSFRRTLLAAPAAARAAMIRERLAQ